MAIDDIAEQLAKAARELGSEDVGQTLEKAVQLSVELVAGCDGAGVTLVRNQSLQTPASSEDWVARGDALQYELQEGPCTDAVWDHELVHSHDLANDARWPRWGPRVVSELDVRSMLCIQLFADESTLGALNLYSRDVGAFADSNAHFEAQALAAHVAVALVAAEEIQHLHTGMVNRTVIGQAEGIIMERFDVSADTAFAVLKRVSMDSNVKLSTVASEFVRTRQLPQTPDGS